MLQGVSIIRDGNLNYFKMYRIIVSFIQDSPDMKWRDELSSWWNKYVLFTLEIPFKGNFSGTRTVVVIQRR
jgi:hypothetical protein